MPSRIAMVGVVGNVLIHLGFERCYQHASGTLLHQRIQIQLECILLVLFRSNYAQHAAYLSLDGLSAVSGRQQPGGYAALLISAPIHNIRLYLKYNHQQKCGKRPEGRLVPQSSHWGGQLCKARQGSPSVGRGFGPLEFRNLRPRGRHKFPVGIGVSGEPPAAVDRLGE
jgi:hypothetical protein